jgi:hypothetical protein
MDKEHAEIAQNKNGQTNNNQVLSSSTGAGKKGYSPADRKKSTNDPEYVRERWMKRKWIALKSAGPDRHIELFFTFGIVFFAALQLCITYHGSKSNGEQIDKIIAAADRISNAADSFSGSAAHINDGVSQAVTKLESQAATIEKARIGSNKQSADSLQATINDFHEDQRPWVGLDDVICDICDGGPNPALDPKTHIPIKNGIPTSEHFTVGDLMGLVANTGITPAIDTHFDTTTTRLPSDPIPTYGLPHARNWFYVSPRHSSQHASKYSQFHCNRSGPTLLHPQVFFLAFHYL